MLTDTESTWWFDSVMAVATGNHREGEVVAVLNGAVAPAFDSSRTPGIIKARSCASGRAAHDVTGAV